VVALAASAGGLAALSAVLGNLPAGFPAPVVIVQHLDPRRRSLMANILSRRTALTVKEVEDGDVLRPATVYVAPPDKHVLVTASGRLALTSTALIHFVRPSADLLFASAAEVFKERTVAVVLSGTGSDGSGGVRAVREQGGTVIAQDAATAEFFGMPQAAIETGGVDRVLPLEEIAPALVALVSRGEPS
jgi:two-component system chemotaxis response regulator CheB